MKIAVDFDGTIVENQYPKIGPEIPGALNTLRELEDLGHQIILCQVRKGRYLDQAVEYCRENGVDLWDQEETLQRDTKWHISNRAIGDLIVSDRQTDWNRIRQILRSRGVPLI